jgi:hypothetical protein
MDSFTCIAPASSRVNRNLTDVKRGNRQLNEVPKVQVARPGSDLWWYVFAKASYTYGAPFLSGSTLRPPLKYDACLSFFLPRAAPCLCIIPVCPDAPVASKRLVC